jgi:excisionase family DNA binding protein
MDVSSKKVSGGNQENSILPLLFSDKEDLQSSQETGTGESCSEDDHNEYISLAEAASRAFMSRQAISRYAEKGCFKFCRVGRKVRISRNGFERWLATRQEELMKY